MDLPNVIHATSIHSSPVPSSVLSPGLSRVAETRLKYLFQQFCAFGGDKNQKFVTTLNNIRFAKFVRDANLLDRNRCTFADIDAIFEKVKGSWSQRHITYRTFRDKALPMIADKKGCGIYDLIREILKIDGPRRQSSPTSNGLQCYPSTSRQSSSQFVRPEVMYLSTERKVQRRSAERQQKRAEGDACLILVTRNSEILQRIEKRREEASERHRFSLRERAVTAHAVGSGLLRRGRSAPHPLPSTLFVSSSKGSADGSVNRRVQGATNVVEPPRVLTFDADGVHTPPCPGSKKTEEKRRRLSK